ncbi:MAG: glycosyl hydrolase family 92 [Bacteroidetes bacterium HGW-Bacteroidetes-5]|jgi:predicted alpha-1,2-mannosidase|nr:MAG: glycosyl hydrolase family 92 [Bacteroidetes bacterium HGW-Bacteroidetes-5]
MRTKVVALLIIAIVILQCCVNSIEKNGAASFVNPFIGTDAHGHTYPGATVPFGMVQLSPQTRLTGWDGCSGYHYSDSVIYGFAHTALNGTGISDYGDILLMPVVGEPVFDNLLYSSEFKKESEKAGAGYYRVWLDKPGVLAEMTATARVGYHRYTFPKSELSNIIIDLKHRDKVTESRIEIINDREIRGMRRSSNWAKDVIWYFHMEFSKPFSRSGIAVNDTLITAGAATGTNIKAFVGFETKKGETIEVKVSLSAVDSQGAKLNLESEIPEWGFDSIREKGVELWNSELGKIAVKGGTKKQMRVFYTALYHTMVQPNIFMDTDGRYRGIDRKIHTAQGFTNYTIFSLWDTYRTWHPLMTIIDQKRSSDYINTMLNIYDKGGLLPIWELAGNETYCMIGNHAISAIADAWMKGIRSFDGDVALKAMVNSATKEHYGLGIYIKHQFIPSDKEHGSISKTLEYAYNDWCIAVMAKDLGNDALYREYITRAQSYKNIFCTTTGFMRPRLNGSWLTPFNPTTIDWHFVEANSWHYSFYVPQDITGLTRLHGGKERLAAKIDELFETDAPITGMDMKDITVLIGQYAQGNEPSHHMAYLYNFVDQPWKTQFRVRQIMDDFFTDQPNGLSGNEDCGQMSAWLVMSAMGFYPVTPGNTDYIIGTPWLPQTEIRLENGNLFRIVAKGVSAKNRYIQSATLNGETYTKSYISHSAIMAGGELRFVMGSKPNKEWGIGEDNTPATAIEDELIVPVPFLIADGPIIKDSTTVAMGTIIPGCKIYYTLDSSEPDTTSAEYTSPLNIKTTTTVKAVAYKQGEGLSKSVEGRFTKIALNRSVVINTPYNRNYTGGGPEALIDGIRGSENWRLGGWQGYQATDFEAVIDLGKVENIKYLAGGFVRDIRSWIWFPKSVIFYTSEDGVNFKEAGRVKNSIADDDYEISREDFELKTKSRGRYVKVKAINYGKIPAWHLGAGGDAFIFIDEIIVN